MKGNGRGGEVRGCALCSERIAFQTAENGDRFADCAARYNTQIEQNEWCHYTSQPTRTNTTQHNNALA